MSALQKYKAKTQELQTTVAQLEAKIRILENEHEKSKMVGCALILLYTHANLDLDRCADARSDDHLKAQDLVKRVLPSLSADVDSRSPTTIEAMVYLLERSVEHDSPCPFDPPCHLHRGR